MPCGVACVCSLCWKVLACQPLQCLCHQAYQAALAAVLADDRHPGGAGAVDLAPVAASGEARKEWLVACCAAQPDSAELALIVDDIDSEHSAVILGEDLQKACACAAQEPARDLAPVLPATVQATPRRA